MAIKLKTRICPSCGENFIGHPNKRFCGQRCKDGWHNANNPRGIQVHLEPHIPKTNAEIEHETGMNCLEGGWDGHKNVF